MKYEAGVLHLFYRVIESSKLIAVYILIVLYLHLIDGPVRFEQLAPSGLMFSTLGLASELMHLAFIFRLVAVFLSITISSFLIISHPLGGDFIQEA